MTSCSITETLSNPVPEQLPEEKVVGGGNYVEHQALQVLASLGFSESSFSGFKFVIGSLSCNRFSCGSASLWQRTQGFG